jgi:hypothetical protein
MERRLNSHLRSLSQLLFAMEERVLVAADRGCLWAKISTGPRMVHSNVIERNKIISCKNGI